MKILRTAALFLICFICFNAKLFAQALYTSITDEEAKSMNANWQNAQNNNVKVNMLLDLAFHQLSKTDKVKKNLDTAGQFIDKAKILSTTLNYLRGRITSDLFRGILYTFQDKDEQAVLIYKRLLADTKKAKLYDLEGRTWYQYGILQENKGRLNSYQLAKEAYRKAGDYVKMNYMNLLTANTNLLSIQGQYFPGRILISPSNIPGINQKLAQTKSADERLDLLLRLASVYIYRTGEEKIHIDSALFLLDKAKNLSLKLKNKHGFNESLLLNASAYQEKNEIGRITKIMKLLNDTSKAKLLINLSDHYWYAAGKTAGRVNKNFVDSSYFLSKKGLALSKTLKNPKYIKESMDRMIRVAEHRIQYEKMEIEQAYAYILENCDAKSYPSKSRIYGTFCGHYNNRGNFLKALQYAQLAEKNLNDSITDDDRCSVYASLLMVYKSMGKYEKSLTYHLKIIDGADKFGKKLLIYSVISSYAECLITMNRAKEALSYIQKIHIKLPPERQEAITIYHVALGHCYKALNQFEPAEKNYLEAIKSRERSRLNANSLHFDLVKLYVSNKMFEKANIAFKNAEKHPPYNIASYLITYYAVKSQIDSALGIHNSAYNHLSRSKKMSDSVYMISKERNTQELEIQYETQKKEAALRSKEENILFLNQNAELFRQKNKIQQAKLVEANLLAQKNDINLKLKQKDIDLLNQKAKLQLNSIQKKDFQQNVIIGTAFMLLLVTILLYLLYRNKQINNKKLEIQQQKIELNNNDLRNLLGEKEWLLKEIHHRVKNNLHTVMSLLESQSAYLENDALEAIRNSRHRIFAMSLIHQKLYQSDGVRTINMAQYIPELISYLKDGFDVKNDIQFIMDIAPVEFDVAEAVPMGLIINEVITNSLKYAFQNKDNGMINISLKMTDTDLYQLVMQDNGVGLPEDFQLKTVNSLGMKLIKGLTGQLDAELTIENINGTKITISSLSIRNSQTIKSIENKVYLESA